MCHRIIWYALDQGMPVYCDTADLTLTQELHARLSGLMTFNHVPRIGLWLRDEYGVRRSGIVLAQHEHHSGFDKLEGPTCRTATSKKATDLKPPPF